MFSEKEGENEEEEEGKEKRRKGRGRRRRKGGKGREQGRGRCAGVTRRWQASIFLYRELLVDECIMNIITVNYKNCNLGALTGSSARPIILSWVIWRLRWWKVGVNAFEKVGRRLGRACGGLGMAIPGW